MKTKGTELEFIQAVSTDLLKDIGQVAQTFCLPIWEIMSSLCFMGLELQNCSIGTLFKRSAMLLECIYVPGTVLGTESTYPFFLGRETENACE